MNEEVVEYLHESRRRSWLTGSRLGLNPSRALGENREHDDCVFCRVKGMGETRAD